MLRRVEAVRESGTDRGATTTEPAAGTDRGFGIVTLWLLTLGTGVVSAALVRLRHGVDPDLWLHLRIGLELRGGEHFGRLPDPLVVLADRAYSPTQWLSEVLVSLVHQATGMVGVLALRSLGIVLLLAFVQLTCAVYTSPVRAAAVAMPTMVATAAQWGERPQLAGLVLLAATTWVWSRARRDATVPWLAVPLTLLWAMMHGSWVLGVATGVLFLLAMVLERPRRARPWGRLVGVVAAALVAVGMTPLGPALLLNPFAVGAAARGRVNEWAAPSPGNPLVVLVVLMGVVVLALSLRHLRDRLPELLLALAGVAMAVTAVRTIAFGALLVAPALAAVLATRPGALVSPSRLSPWPLVTTGALVLLFPGIVFGAPSTGPLPRSVDRVVAQLPAGAVVAVEPASSGWVLWKHPQVRPLRDLRAEIYSGPVADSYESFYRARPGWQAYAAGQGIEGMVLVDGSALDDALRTESGWREVVRDAGYVLWQRTG